MIEQNKNWGLKSFIPLLTFLAVYLGAGVVFSLMGTENPFKQISREFAVLCGLTTVILLSRSRKNIDLNIDLVAKHCGEPGVMLMIMIFALAGAFSGAAEAMGGTEAAVNFGLSIIPRQFVFAGVFVISSVRASFPPKAAPISMQGTSTSADPCINTPPASGIRSLIYSRNGLAGVIG